MDRQTSTVEVCFERKGEHRLEPKLYKPSLGSYTLNNTGFPLFPILGFQRKVGFSAPGRRAEKRCQPNHSPKISNLYTLLLS